MHEDRKPFMTTYRAMTNPSHAPMVKSPLRGPLRLGAGMLSGDLWGFDLKYNPLMYYYSRGLPAFFSDMVGFLPWLTLCGFNLALAYQIIAFSLPPDLYFVYMLGEVILLFLFSPIWFSLAIMVSFRRASVRLPMEQLLLTRLKPIEIVHGLTIRAAAVQSLGIICFSLFSILGSLFLFDQLQGGILVICLLSALCFYHLGRQLELDLAMTLRANLFIKDKVRSFLRVIVDMYIREPYPVLYTILFVLIFGLAGFMDLHCILWIGIIVWLIIDDNLNEKRAGTVITQSSTSHELWWQRGIAAEEDKSISGLLISWPRLLKRMRDQAQ